MPNTHTITVTVNGTSYTRSVEPRLLLSDFLRHELDLTGTHVGCEHGSCGACTVLLHPAEVDETEATAPVAVRSCILFAVQVDGHAITTVEGLAPGGDPANLHPIQRAFWEKHGLQCGYCTPGFLLTLLPFLDENPDPSEAEIRTLLSGNICRCTGYQNIVDAALLAADMLRDERGSQDHAAAYRKETTHD